MPSREPVFSEEDKKQMMSYAYRKQEEMKVSIQHNLQLCLACN